MRRIALVLICGLTACASATLTAFRDPAFTNRRFDKIAVFALGMYLDNAVSVERQICEKVAPAPCVPGEQLLPPTRAYSTSEIGEYLGKAGVDGVLIISLVGDESATNYLGTITSGSTTINGSQSGQVNLYQNSAIWNATSKTTATTQAVTTPIYQHDRTAFAQVGLFERSSGNIAWRGDMRVSGKGDANVSDGAFIRAATNEIAAKLKAADILSTPAGQ